VRDVTDIVPPPQKPRVTAECESPRKVEGHIAKEGLGRSPRGRPSRRRPEARDPLKPVLSRDANLAGPNGRPRSLTLDDRPRPPRPTYPGRSQPRAAHNDRRHPERLDLSRRCARVFGVNHVESARRRSAHRLRQDSRLGHHETDGSGHTNPKGSSSAEAARDPVPPARRFFERISKYLGLFGESATVSGRGSGPETRRSTHGMRTSVEELRSRRPARYKTASSWFGHRGRSAYLVMRRRTSSPPNPRTSARNRSRGGQETLAATTGSTSPRLQTAAGGGRPSKVHTPAPR